MQKLSKKGSTSAMFDYVREHIVTIVLIIVLIALMLSWIIGPKELLGGLFT